MDVPLYAVGLTLFAVLYLAIGVFLVWAILVSLIIMFLFLTLRYGNVSQDYPHSAGDVSITAIFIGITWGIFVFVGPKSPIPFIGNGFTYTPSTAVPVSEILTVAVALLVGFLVVYSFAADRLAESRGQTSSSAEAAAEGGSKPKQGVGA